MADQKQEQSKAMVAGPAARLDQLKTYFEKAKGSIEAVVPKHLTAERLMKIVTTAASRTPTLLECTPQSVLCALIDCATLGLEPSTPLGLAYLVPFRNNKSGKTECQLQVGYKGYIQLAYQSGDVSVIYADIIREKDDWDYELGTNKRLYHKPPMGLDRGAIVAAYAVVRLVHGGQDFALLSKGEIDAIREGSPGKGSEAWVSHYPEMAKKTAIRRLAKTIPLSTEKNLARAIDNDDAHDGGRRAYNSVIDVLPSDDAEGTNGAPMSRGEALTEKLTAGQA